MRSRLMILGTALVTMILSVSPTGTSPVEGLNELLLERFRSLDGFGMARIPTIPQHVYRFDPETPDEEAAVEDLRKRGWTVGLYLGGRGLLEPSLSEREWKEAGEYSTRRTISPPLVISGQTTPAGLPEPWKLQAIGRKALVASSTSDRYRTSLGRWSVDVRPIRAHRAACFECHREKNVDLKIGDALGVALYLYRRQAP